MTPTIEEVIRVAKECGIGLAHQTFQAEALKAFAQHYIEVGRKQEADEAADLLDNLNRTISNMLAANAEAIRNNTGE